VDDQLNSLYQELHDDDDMLLNLDEGVTSSSGDDTMDLDSVSIMNQ